MNATLTTDQIQDRARAAIRKVDLNGLRGITCLSIEEIEALVVVAVLSGSLMAKAAPSVTETTKEKGE